MHTIIRVGEISVLFYKSRHETGGVMDLFEFTVPPAVGIIVPHLHRDFDETIIGIDGVMTWTVGDRTVKVSKAEELFIPRGTPHRFETLTSSSARMMCMLTPGLIGPEYFVQLGSLLSGDSPPDFAEIGSFMASHGLIPLTPPGAADAVAAGLPFSSSELGLIN